MLNPPLDKILKDQPVCQFPRASYNRIAQIIGNLKVGRGLIIERGKDDHWTIRIDEVWLTQFIEALVSPDIDAAQNETSLNVGGGSSESVEVVTDVSWDNSSHKLKQTKKTLGVGSAGTATTTDVFTAAAEMP